MEMLFLTGGLSIQLTGEFNNCTLENNKAHPDEWFIALDKFRNMMRQIDTSFENEQNASN